MVEKNILKDQMKKAFPSRFDNDIESLFDELELSADYFHSHVEEYCINLEYIFIPYRIYIDFENIDIEILNPVQKRLVLYYFTRHHNGYIREKCLRKLLEVEKISDFEIPYLMLLCGEYVLQIISEAFRGLQFVNDKDIIQFIAINHSQVQLLEARMISYWNEYYRRVSDRSLYHLDYSNWENYIGHEILNYLKLKGYKTRK